MPSTVVCGLLIVVQSTVCTVVVSHTGGTCTYCDQLTYNGCSKGVMRGNMLISQCKLYHVHVQAEEEPFVQVHVRIHVHVIRCV